LQQLIQQQEKTIKSFEALTDSQVDQKIARAAEVFPAFRKLPFAERARMMIKAAEILENEKESLGRLMTTEMGKTLRSAEEEAVKCAWGCRYYAEHAERFLADDPVETPAKPQFYSLPAAGRHPGRDAVELSVLASVPLHRAGIDGGQCSAS